MAILLLLTTLVASGCGSSAVPGSNSEAKGTPAGTHTFRTSAPIEGLDGHQYQGSNFDVLYQIY